MRTLTVVRGFVCDIECMIIRMLREQNITKDVGLVSVRQNTSTPGVIRGEIVNFGHTYVLEAVPSIVMSDTTWFISLKVDIYRLIQHHADFHKLEKKARAALRSVIAGERAQLRESATVWSAPSLSEDDAP